MDASDHHNYVSLELDGQYIGRLKIDSGEIKSYPITILSQNKKHPFSIFKATEASTGRIVFGGTTDQAILFNQANLPASSFISE